MKHKGISKEDKRLLKEYGVITDSWVGKFFRDVVLQLKKLKNK